MFDSPEVASLLQSWCRSYFCALVRPFMEAGLHDDGLSKEAQGLLKPGAAREPWTFLPEQSYFAASRGHTRHGALGKVWRSEVGAAFQLCALVGKVHCMRSAHAATERLAIGHLWGVSSLDILLGGR